MLALLRWASCILVRLPASMGPVQVLVDPFPPACTDQQPDDPTQMKVLSIKQGGHLHTCYHTFGSGTSCGIIKRVVAGTTLTQCWRAK